VRAVTRVDCRRLILNDFTFAHFSGDLFAVGSFGGLLGRCISSLIRCRFFNLLGLLRHSHSPLEASIETVSARRLGQYTPNDCHSQRSSHG
jgi:hypothetical protein